MRQSARCGDLTGMFLCSKGTLQPGLVVIVFEKKIVINSFCFFVAICEPSALCGDYISPTFTAYMIWKSYLKYELCRKQSYFR